MLLLQRQQRKYFDVIILVLFLLLSESVAENDGITGDFEQPKAQKLRVKKVLEDSKYLLTPTEVAEPLNDLQQQQTSKEAEAAAAILQTPDEKIMNKQNTDDVAKQPPLNTLEAKNKTGIIKTQLANNEKQKNLAASTTTTSSISLSSLSLQHMNNAGEDISDSLKAGFYFFVALSFSGICFIFFKVYRLRLSRAERKYGVQGDRSTQELTPLPIAIEDGHSDEEDQTLFEVQRQNIRIL